MRIAANHSTALRLSLKSAQDIFEDVQLHRPPDVGTDDFPVIEGFVNDRLLGRGASGDVCLAVDASMNKRVAIKLFRDPIHDEKSNRRIWRELELLADAKLDCMPGVHRFGVSHNRMYLVSDYIDGVDLLTYCRRKNFDCRQIVTLLVRVAHAVQEMHERRIIHRDLKPSNILVTPQGKPYIIDLGIAFTEPDKWANMTLEVSGSLPYMAPEQAKQGAEITTRSDVFSLAATASEILTGHTPFDVTGSPKEVLRRIAEGVPRHPQALDPAMDDDLAYVLARALAIDPHNRYETAQAFAHDLQHWLDRQIIPEMQVSVTKRARFWIRKNKIMAALSAACFIALISSVSFGWVASVQAAEARDADRLRAAAEAARNDADLQRAAAEASRNELEDFVRRWKQQVRAWAADTEAIENGDDTEKLASTILAARETMSLLTPKLGIDDDLSREYIDHKIKHIMFVLNMTFPQEQYDSKEALIQVRNLLHDLETNYVDTLRGE